MNMKNTIHPFDSGTVDCEKFSYVVDDAMVKASNFERDALDRGSRLLASYLKEYAKGINTLGGLSLLRKELVGEFCKFADFIAAHEREACAKIAEEYDTWEGNPACNIAQAIRERNT